MSLVQDVRAEKHYKMFLRLVTVLMKVKKTIRLASSFRILNRNFTRQVNPNLIQGKVLENKHLSQSS